MSISSLFSIGQSALFASYAAIQTTSNNISNANTTGYSRQEVQLAPANGMATNVGYFGSGVDVTTISRSYNQYLTSQANSTNSVSTADQAQLNYLTQLQGVFGTQKSGIGYTAGQFLNSFVDVADAPSDSSARQVALSDANQLSSQLASAGQQVQTLQSGVTQDVTAQIATVNSLAQQVATLNQQIASATAAGQPPNDLLDQRDKLINQIGGYMNVTAIPADNGSISLFVGGGQNLVLGTTANTLKAVPDTYDSSKVQIALQTGTGPNQIVPSNAITGGSIGGMLKFQNDDLTDAAALLGQMATAISGAVNQQQALGLDLNGSTGSPIFSVATPRVLSASTNGGNAGISVSVNNASQVQASDYKLTFDGSNYSLVRQSDNTVSPGSPFTPSQLAAGVSVDGITVKLNAGTPSAGDSFMLQPVSTAASSMQTVLADPSGIAAASPFTASMGAANTGTATVAGLTASSPSYNPALSATINFTSGAGAYSYTLSDGTTGTGTWTAGSPITINGFSLQLSGVPKSGDTIAIAPTTAVSSSNGNAQAFFNMGTSPIVNGNDVTDAYSNVVANIGVRVQTVTQASTNSSAAASDAETARANDSGVNLDEEASRLMQFQQSYQAAAKILQTAQAVFDTLIQTISAT
jgi:flagellar hook-associated protein 1 FlgK